MSKAILLVLLLFNEVSGYAQHQGKEYHAELMAKEQVSRLKQGALFVMLESPKAISQDTRNNVITVNEYQYSKQIHQKNRSIIWAFKKKYFFSLVYFFTYDQLDKIKQKRWEEVSFLNENGLHDPSIRISSDFVLIAVVGSSRGKNVNDESIFNEVKNKSILIFDARLNEVPPPFPNRERIYSAIYPSTWRQPYYASVKRLNKKLFTLFGH